MEKEKKEEEQVGAEMGQTHFSLVKFVLPTNVRKQDMYWFELPFTRPTNVM